MTEEAVVGPVRCILEMFGVVGVVWLVPLLGVTLETEQEAFPLSSQEERAFPARGVLGVTGRLIMAGDTGDLSAGQRKLLGHFHFLGPDIHHVDTIDRPGMARSAQRDVLTLVEEIACCSRFSLDVAMVAM